MNVLERGAILSKYYIGRIGFHNENHVCRMLDGLQKYDLSDTNRETLKYSILYHDVIHNVKNPQQDEKLSCETFLKDYADATHLRKDDICQLIMATKHHEHTSSRKSLTDIIIDLDLEVLYSDIFGLMNYEHLIFREYQFTTLQYYIEKRVEFLEKIKSKLDGTTHIDELIKYVKHRTYRIGIYPGSFNPFHIGHKNITEKAEDVFDKVIIARGINVEKSAALCEMPKSLPNQIFEYKGLVTDLFDKVNYFGSAPVELFFVRGLRSVYDIGYEEQLRKIVHDINATIKFVYFFCDSGMEHISSSQIRGLLPFDKHAAEKYLVP